MNIMLTHCSMRLPTLLDQPPAGQRCACYRWQHRDRARDTARTSFIDADGVTGNGLGGMLTTGIDLHARLTRLESP
jgi:hypothetical protein